MLLTKTGCIFPLDIMEDLHRLWFQELLLGDQGGNSKGKMQLLLC